MTVGELAGHAERKTGKVLHSAAEKSGDWGLCLSHDARLDEDAEVIWTVGEYQALNEYLMC
jgi:hypothetical protein